MTELTLDLALNSSGWCVGRKDKIVFGKIVPSSKLSEDDKIYYIYKCVRKIIKKYNVTDITMETQFVGSNRRVALILSRVRGSLVPLFKKYKININYLSPAEIKVIVTGNKSASKEEVSSVILNIYKDNLKVQNIGPLNSKSCKAKNDDIYDAIAIRVASETLRKKVSK